MRFISEESVCSMNIETIWGLFIPFFSTGLGAALAFVLNTALSANVIVPEKAEFSQQSNTERTQIVLIHAPSADSRDQQMR